MGLMDIINGMMGREGVKTRSESKQTVLADAENRLIAMKEQLPLPPEDKLEEAFKEAVMSAQAGKVTMFAYDCNATELMFKIFKRNGWPVPQLQRDGKLKLFNIMSSSSASPFDAFTKMPSFPEVVVFFLAKESNPNPQGLDKVGIEFKLFTY